MFEPGPAPGQRAIRPDEPTPAGALESRLAELAGALDAANERWHGTLVALRDELERLGGRLHALPAATLDPDAELLVGRGADPSAAAELSRRARARVTPARGVTLALAPDLAAEIARAVRVVPPLWARRGRTVAALLGASGVGKTTAALQIALEARDQHAKRVALVAVGPPRAGDRERLLAHAPLPVAFASDAPALAAALDAFAAAELVLVDTPGASPWCPRARAAVEELLADAPVGRHLVLPATLDAAALPRIIDSYADTGLASLIVTKLDEARGPAAVLSVVRASRVALSHLARGPAVPGAIVAADGAAIAREVLELGASAR